MRIELGNWGYWDSKLWDMGDTILAVSLLGTVLFFSTCSTPCPAQETGTQWLSTTFTSYHVDRSKNYNERNYGLSYQRHLEREHIIQGGFYDNSNNKTTVYMAYIYQPIQTAHWRFGGMAGLGSGYESHKILGSLVASYEQGRYGVDFYALPSVVYSFALKYAY